MAVEGLDEKNFFDKLLKYLDISDFQIEDVGGKEKFPKRFPALLKTPGFFAADSSPLVTHLAIIRDKDEDQALKSIIKIVQDAGLTPPAKHSAFSKSEPKVGVFIMPGSKVKGTMLEDLCLKTVESHPAMKCVNEFASCASALKIKPKNLSKAKVQTFLAAQPEIANSVGVGAQKGYWDFNSSALDELKQFLNNLK
ncbi:MAG: DUF3226 domain-containing protein [Phycisphaerae bacterium]